MDQRNIVGTVKLTDDGATQTLDRVQAAMLALRSATEQQRAAGQLLAQQLTTLTSGQAQAGQSADSLKAALTAVTDADRGAMGATFALKQSVTELANEGGKATASTNTLKSAVGTLAQSATSAGGGVSSLSATTSNLGGAASTTQPLLQRLLTTASGMGGGLGGAASSATSLTSSLGGLTGGATSAGGAMGGMGGGALAAAGGIVALAVAVQKLEKDLLQLGVASAQQAIAFQTMVTEIQNNTGMADQAITQMSANIKTEMAESNVSMAKLGEGFAHAANFGFDAASQMLILESAMKSASTTGGDTAKTADLLASTLHHYGLEATQAASVTDILHVAAQRSNSTFEQFAQNSNRATAVAANLHVPLDQTAAALAALTRNGFNASEAQTQFVNILTHMIRPSNQAHDALRDLSKASGVDLVADFSAAGLHAKGLTGVMDDLHRVYRILGYSQDQATQTTLTLLNAQRGGLGMAVLMGKGQKDYNENLRTFGDVMSGKVTPTQDTYNRSMQTAGYQLGILGNKVELAKIEFGEKLLPTIKLIVSAAGDLLDIVVKVASALGFVLTPVLQIVGGLLNIVGTAMGFVGGAMKGASDALFGHADAVRKVGDAYQSVDDIIAAVHGNIKASTADTADSVQTGMEGASQSVAGLGGASSDTEAMVAASNAGVADSFADTADRVSGSSGKIEEVVLQTWDQVTGAGDKAVAHFKTQAEEVADYQKSVAEASAKAQAESLAQATATAKVETEAQAAIHTDFNKVVADVYDATFGGHGFLAQSQSEYIATLTATYSEEVTQESNKELLHRAEAHSKNKLTSELIEYLHQQLLAEQAAYNISLEGTRRFSGAMQLHYKDMADGQAHQIARMISALNMLMAKEAQAAAMALPSPASAGKALGGKGGNVHYGSTAGDYGGVFPSATYAPYDTNALLAGTGGADQQMYDHPDYGGNYLEGGLVWAPYDAEKERAKADKAAAAKGTGGKKLGGTGRSGSGTGAGGGTGKGAGGSGGGGKTPEQMAKETEDAAKRVEDARKRLDTAYRGETELDFTDKIAAAKGVVAAAQEKLNAVTDYYAGELGKLKDLLAVNAAQEKAANAQNIADYRQKSSELAGMKSRHEDVQHSLQTQIHTTEQTLKTLEASAQTALKPLEEDARKAEAAVASLRREAEAQREAFAGREHPLKEQLYGIQEEARRTLTILDAEIDTLQGKVAAAHANTQAVAAMANALVNGARAHTEEVQAAQNAMVEAARARTEQVQQEQGALVDAAQARVAAIQSDMERAAAEFESRLQPMRDELASLKRADTKTEHTAELTKMADAVRNYQARLQNANLTEQERIELQRKLKEAQGQYGTKGREYSLEENIAQAEAQKEASARADGERLKAAQEAAKEVQASAKEAIEAVQQEQKAVEKSAAAAILAAQNQQKAVETMAASMIAAAQAQEDAANSALTAKQAERAADEASFNKRMEQVTLELAAIQHEREEFEYNEHQKELAAAAEVERAKAAVLNTRALYDALEKPAKDYLLSLKDTYDQYTYTAGEEERTKKIELEGIQERVDAVHDQYSKKAEEINSDITLMEGHAKADKAAAQTVVDSAKDREIAIGKERDAWVDLNKHMDVHSATLEAQKTLVEAQAKAIDTARTTIAGAVKPTTELKDATVLAASAAEGLAKAVKDQAAPALKDKMLPATSNMKLPLDNLALALDATTTKSKDLATVHADKLAPSLHDMGGAMDTYRTEHVDKLKVQMDRLIPDTLAYEFAANWDYDKEKSFKKLMLGSLHDMGNAEQLFVEGSIRRFVNWESRIVAAMRSVITAAGEVGTAIAAIPQGPGGSGTGTGTPPGGTPSGGGSPGQGVYARIGMPSGSPQYARESVGSLSGAGSGSLGGVGMAAAGGGVVNFIFPAVQTVPSTAQGWLPYTTSLKQAWLMDSGVKGYRR